MLVERCLEVMTRLVQPVGGLGIDIMQPGKCFANLAHAAANACQDFKNTIGFCAVFRQVSLPLICQGVEFAGSFLCDLSLADLFQIGDGMLVV